MQIGMKGVKLSPLADDIILCIEDPRINQKQSELINKFSKVARYKINTRICSISIHYQLSKKETKQFHLQEYQKQLNRNKFRQQGERSLPLKLQNIDKRNQRRYKWKGILCS